MSLESIAGLLQQAIGLHSATVGTSTIRQAVNSRMRACNIELIDAYLDIIRSSSTELDILIDEVIVPETWFFRDQNPFTAFTLWVQENSNRFTAINPLRILSLPCSSGEEAYTLAMCLADSGIPAAEAQIDAIDISTTNLLKAREALYGANSFRGANLSYRDRYFRAEENCYRLNEEITRRVNFERANLLDEDCLSQGLPYHVIFCRNLLIYFDRQTQQRAMDRIESLLSADGLVFLGHSETSLLKNRAFIAMDYARSFGFRRGKPARKSGDPLPLPPPGRRKHPGRAPERPLADFPPSYQAAAAEQPASRQRACISSAFRLADEGHLDEAANMCETLLRQGEDQAEAHYLLGVIREAAGNSVEAEQLFRKTVYLNPRHFKALTHLSVIAGRSGDDINAQRFRDRAARAQAASGQGRAEQ